MKKAHIMLAIILLNFCCFGDVHAQSDQVAIHGFISQGFLKTTRNNYVADSTDGTFQFNEMGINFSCKPIEKLILGIQFFARDFGAVGNDEIQVDYAVADYRLKDYFGLRAGRMKNPIGRYSEYRDIDMLRTPINLPYSIYDENYRDSQSFINGVGVYGDINTSSLGSIGYQAIIGSNNIAADSADGAVLGGNAARVDAIACDTAYALSLVYSDPTGSLRLGGTYFTIEFEANMASLSDNEGLPKGTEFRTEFNNVEIFAFSFEYTWNNLTLLYEYKYSKIRNVDMYMASINYLLASGPIDNAGGYVMVNYQLTDKLSTSVYYDEFYRNRYDRSGKKPNIFGYEQIQHWMKKWSFAFKYDINSNWLVKAEADYIDGVAGLLTLYNSEDGFKEHWWVFAGKLSYNF